jgi:hypothetical protein
MPILKKVSSSWWPIVVMTMAGFALILFSFIYFQNPNPSATFHLRLAWVENEFGAVAIYRKNLTQKQTVDKRNPLFNLESAETQPNSSALLFFENLWQIHLEENTLVTIEKLDSPDLNQMVLFIKRGQIKIKQVGRAKELFIAKNGERIFAEDYAQSLLYRSNVIKPQVINFEEKSNTTLNESQISEVVMQNRTAYFKCYTSMLSRNNQAKGQVLVSLIIEKNGKSQARDINAPETFDSLFKSCVSAVADRMVFPSLVGTEFSTVFPLVFE